MIRVQFAVPIATEANFFPGILLIFSSEDQLNVPLNI